MALPPVYNPRDVEAHWYPKWESKGFFAPSPDAPRPPFTIVIPPPNVTGILHMGHALNNTLQDVLIRFRRMQGHAALWVPGTDHAGIATQNVVERQLAKEGLTRQALGREEFVKRVWAWREQYGSTIVQQLRRLGASCDWSRECFTMDKERSRAVETAFLKLHKEGLIYRGYYLVNWCPRCQTALSDEEVLHEEVAGKLWYIRYPSKGQETGDRGQGIVVATTRPETMLGDVAVAVHPKDDRYTALHEKTVILPILKRSIPIIQDPTVERKFGTGAVKITPAHDPNDFLLGQKHKLNGIRVMDASGRMNEQAGPYKGMDRFECRKRIVSDLEKEGLLVKTEDYKTSIGHCYRCRTVIEPTLSPQWFVKMKPLAKLGIEAVEKDGMKFFPPRWTKVYLDWLTHIRDWCISRQIWWGHRIPAWYCQRCYPAYLKAQETQTLSSTPVMDPQKAGITVGTQPPAKCGACGGGDFKQDEDVLDTWFSSWLWPFSTLGWPEETADLKRFYPTSILVTAQDIIFFWVARMVMAGKFFMKSIPFKEVYIHGIIRVEGGKKMSKSLGNIIDPLEVIDRMGADALRFSISHMASEGQDMYLSENKFLLGRNFANKLWNATRLILEKRDMGHGTGDRGQGAGDKGQGTGDRGEKRVLTVPDGWILSRLQEVIEKVTDALEDLQFNGAAKVLYQFVWHDFCDWYLEIAKIQRQQKDPAVIRSTEWVLRNVLERVLRLLHPFMPFITEELWQRLEFFRHCEEHSDEAISSARRDCFAPSDLAMTGGKSTIMLAAWPEPQAGWKTDGPGLESRELFKRLEDVITGVRNIRMTFHVPPKQKISLGIRGNFMGKDFLEKHSEIIRKLAGVEELRLGPKLERPKGSAAFHLPVGSGFGAWDCFVPLKELVDLKTERQRIEREVKNLQGRAKAKQSRLNNPSFRSKAPAEVVAEEEESLRELEGELSKWNQSLKQIE